MTIPTACLWIRQALERLDESEREILMLREYEQLSYAEIAELLKLPVNTVRSRLFRSRMALKELLGAGARNRDDAVGGQGKRREAVKLSTRGRRGHMNKMIHPIEPEEVMAYLDGELTVERAAVTAAHLGACAECQGLVASLRSISQNLKTWEVEPAKSSDTSSNRNCARGSSAGNREKFFRCIGELARSFGPALGDWSRGWERVTAVLLVMFGTVRFLGHNASNVFSSVGSAS